MDPVTTLLRAFDLATSDQREHFLRTLVGRLSRDEVLSLDKFRSWRDARFDILSSLPAELQLCVVDRLDVRDVYLCTLVCRSWALLFLNAEPTVNHLLSKWFPLLRRKASPHDSSHLLLSRAVRLRYYRSTGRFRSRMTFPLARLINGGFSSGRLERLQHGHTYVDLACSASVERYISAQPQRNGRADVLTRYSHGRLAWQPRGPTSPIVVHDLHTNEHKLYTHPRQTLVAGLNMYLIALGDRLVVGASLRSIIAWDIASGTRHEVTLPNTVTGCATQDDLALITTRGGHLFMWEFPSRLVEVNTAVPPDQTASLPSSLPPTRMLEDPIRNHDPPIAFHPTDRDTIFVACLRGRPPALLCVYELKLRDREYRPSRQFTHDISHHLCQSRRAAGGVISPISVEIRKTDGRGTFQVLKIDLTTEGGPCRVQYVNFNALTTSFSTEVYQIPSRCPDIMSKVSVPWEGQLHTWLADAPSGQVLIVSERCKTLRPLDGAPPVQLVPDVNMITSGMPGVVGRSQENLHAACRDIVRYRDIEESPAIPNYQSAYGFQYVLSFHGKPCTYSGSHRLCCASRHSGQTSSSDSRAYHPLNHAEQTQQSDIHPDTCMALSVYADDSFLAVVTNWGTYTVLSVDPDGQQLR